MKPAIAARAGSGRALLLIMLAATLWGTVGVATKALYGITATNALSIGFFRLAFAVPALALACRITLGRSMLRIARRDLPLMLLVGVTMALYQVCYFAAIARVGVAVAVLVTLCTAPVLVVLLSAWILHERLTAGVGLALLCALIGTPLLVGARATNGLDLQTLIAGVGLALASALGYAVLTLCSRALAGRCHPLQPLLVGFASGALLLLPFALATGFVIAYPPLGWALLLHLGLLPTALAYVLFLIGMRHTRASVASIITLLEPLTATALAWAIFGERLGVVGLAGAALLLGAIGLLYRDEARGARAARASAAERPLVDSRSVDQVQSPVEG